MKSKIASVGLCLILLLPAGYVLAQSEDRDATERRLEALRRQIDESEQQLQRTREEEQSAERTLVNLDREIKVREALISTYQTRIGQLERERTEIQESLDELQREVDQLREQFQNRAIHAYKYGRMHDLALIMGANSINQMLIRIQYLRRFGAHRRQQMSEIERASNELAERRTELQSTIARNQSMLTESRSEQQNLTRLQRERSRLVAELRSRRTGLQEELDEHRQDAERLERQLRALIAAEAIRTRQRDAVDPVAAAETIEMTGSFRENRGQLPWPVEGAVTGGYGMRTHPVYGTRTPSVGVEISTESGQPVRAVFEGIVSQIFVMPGYGTCITVRHGEYTTVYGNLSGLNVSQGQRVQAGQAIARSGTEREPLGSSLFFALFSNERHEDPTPWLRRR